VDTATMSVGMAALLYFLRPQQTSLCSFADGVGGYPNPRHGQHNMIEAVCNIKDGDNNIQNNDT
jgi:hypothetical protein